MLNYHADPEPKRIIDQALAARTSEDVEQVTCELRQWVRDHSHDYGIRDAFELLSHRRDFLAAKAELEPSASPRT